jgi:hypothetical protein
MATPKETKPGVRTTEFWTMLFSNALGIVQLLVGPVNVHDGKTLTVLGIVNGAYIASRGLAKQGVPFTEEG